MKTSIKKIAVIVLLLYIGSMAGQDMHMSQYYVNPLFFNPAFAGASKDIEIGLQFKDQWQSVKNGFRTYGFSGSMQLHKNKNKNAFLAIGINTFSDKAGDGKISLTKFELPIACQVKLNGLNKIGGGLQVSFGQRTISQEAFSWGNQFNGTTYDASLPSKEIFGALNYSFLDLAAGLSWSHNIGHRTVADESGVKNMLGFSVSHINKPVYSFYSKEERLKMKYIFLESMCIDLKNSDISILPSAIVQIQGPTFEVLFGSMIRYELKMESRITSINKGTAISIGLYHRYKDAISLSCQLEYNHYLIGIGYDLNVSNYRTATNGKGGFEISLKWVTPSSFFGNHAKSRI